MREWLEVLAALVFLALLIVLLSEGAEMVSLDATHAVKSLGHGLIP